MPLDKLNPVLAREISDFDAAGRKKPPERVIKGVKRPRGNAGPRFYLEGEGKKRFICLNSNSYLGLNLNGSVIESEESACRKFGAGPGAVRFISGTFRPHLDLEAKLADFHGREASLVFSSAYGTSLSVLVPLITKNTVVISDQLNHNCIINATRLARPLVTVKYQHNDMANLEEVLRQMTEQLLTKRVIIVTDGVFSMRGDVAPLAAIAALAQKYEGFFPEGVITVVDDSHGVGAFGQSGRGTEEYSGAKADILIGTLGKAFGVNGGYAVASETVIEYLRNTAPMYIFSNPISPGEAAAALRAVRLVDSPYGRRLLKGLREKTRLFRDGLKNLGFETLEGEHPVVPLITRDPEVAKNIASHLFRHQIMATPIVYSVVPKGEEEIRFQISAALTESDLTTVLDALASFKKQEKPI